MLGHNVAVPLSSKCQCLHHKNPKTFSNQSPGIQTPVSTSFRYVKHRKAWNKTHGSATNREDIINFIAELPDNVWMLQFFQQGNFANGCTWDL